MDTVRAVGAQYERHPYPKMPWIARPVAVAAHPLTYEWGQFLRSARFVPHDQTTRILVAGAGAFEPIVAAYAHPKAQIVAVDLSAASLKRLHRHAWFAGVSRRITCLQADLHESLPGFFDFILCTGVLHHTPEPERIVQRLTECLKPNGLLRIMTYAPESRRLIYGLQQLFASQGLTATTSGLKRKCENAVAALALDDPRRAAFDAYSDARNLSGLIDGFFHAFERPIAIGRFREILENQRLSLLGFGHAWHSQPPSALAPHSDTLGPWERLATLDQAGELAVNPVFWLSPQIESVRIGVATQVRLHPLLEREAAERLFPAPLLDQEDWVSRAIVERAALTALGRERFLAAGLLLSDEGLLPLSLLSNRTSGF